VLIALTALALIVGSFFFSAVVGAVFAGVYREWETMVTRAPLKPVSWAMVALVAFAAFLYPAAGPLGTAAVIALACIIAAFSGREEMPWRIGGLVFYGLVIVAILGMRGNATAGIWAGLYLGTTVWMTDSAAFFTGRQIGGEKLAPDISPSKTWSGALGGLALGTLAGTVVWTLATDSPIWLGTLFSIAISILGQLGDLTESAIKRRFRIKDSGDIIPGHGGLMDRLDSLTYAVLFLAVVGALHAGPAAIAEGFLYW
jgi:phosphatidate cytidylyltransferase